MEDDREKTKNSGETKPETSSSPPPEFEFGSLTPSSPSHDPFSENSPADHLFLNGRLLPHAFPATTTTTRSVSRTTSENTFRSSSTSSRSSDSSSQSPNSYTPRTSTCSVFKITSSSSSDGEKTSLTEKIMGLKPRGCISTKEYYHNHHHKPSKPLTNNGKTVNTTTTTSSKISYFPQCKRKKATEIVTEQLYGSYSRGWQHITPVFKREGSVKSKSSNGGGIIKVKKKTVRTRKKKKVEAKERRGSKLMKWWRKILKVVVLACRECHAMEPQRIVNDDAYVKKKIN